MSAREIRAVAPVAWGLVLTAACAAPAPASPPSAVVVTVPAAATDAPAPAAEPATPEAAPASPDTGVSAVPLELPKATELEDTPITLGVEIAKDGSIFVDGQPVANDEELRQRARAAVQTHGDARAVIRADRDTRYGQVIHVLDLLKQAGVVKIAFGVDQLASPPPAAP